MQLRKRGPAFVATAALLLMGSAGCHPGNSGGSSTGSPVLNGTDAVATINGAPISQSDFYTMLQGYTPNPQNPMAASANAGHAVLQQMITGQLIIGLAKQEGVPATDSQIDGQFRNVKMLQEIHIVKPFEDALADAGFTPDQYKNLQIKVQISQFNLLTKGLTVSDADIKSFYDQHLKDQFTKPNRAHIKRIAFASKIDAAMAADQIKKGAAFETLTSRSVIPQPADGDLPNWLSLDDTSSTLAPLIKVVKVTPASKTSDPFPFQGGWWIVKVVETKPSEVWPLDQVKSLIQNQLLSQKAQQNPNLMTGLQQKMREFQTKAKYEIPEKQYADILAAMTAPPSAPPPTIMTPPPAAAPSKGPTIKVVPSPSPKPGAKP